MEKFIQKNFLTTNEIKFKDNGIQFVHCELIYNKTESFIPYEELDYEKVSRISRISTLRIVFSAILFFSVLRSLTVDDFSISTTLMLSAISIIFLVWTIVGRKISLYIPTYTMGRIELFANRPDEVSVNRFIIVLIQQIKNHHKLKYGQVDNDLPVEQQLQNFRILKEKNILDEREYLDLKEVLFRNNKYGIIGFKKEEKN